MSDDTDAQKYRELQAQAMIEAYEERFGHPPATPGDLSAALDAGLLDNLPRTPEGKVDGGAWRRMHPLA
jgi:hypothetical protein